MNDRNLRGPSLRMMTVAGGWNTTYVMKNTKTMIEYWLPTKLREPGPFAMLLQSVGFMPTIGSMCRSLQNLPSNVGT